MAARTSLSEEEARRVLSQFGLALDRLEALPEKGTINSNFAVAAGGAKYFLRVNEGKSDEDVEGETRVLAHLVSHGVPTPAPLATTSGAPFARHAGRQATLFPWIDAAGEARTLVEEPGFAPVLGAALASLHQVGRGLSAESMPRNHYAVANLQARAKDAARDERVKSAVLLVAGELDRVASGKRGMLPRGLIHQDLFPDNVLVDGDGNLAALIDFEQATEGPLVYDLAVCANAWCWDGAEIRLDTVEEMVRGYETVRPLEETERAEFIDECAYAAARFTLTRITDIFLQGGVPADLAARKDYREFFQRLCFWRHSAS